MKSFGKLIYTPPSFLYTDKNWLILACDDEISRYYRYLYSKDNYPLKLNKPHWGAHISVIKGEVIKNKSFWRADQHKIVEFEYQPGVKDNGIYYWLNIKCPYLSELRGKFGLTDQPKYGFHLTVGKL